MLNLMI